MKKRMTIMIIALFVVFGGIIAFNLFKAFMIKRFFAHYQPPAITVSSATVVKRNWIPHIAAVGSFMAINGVEVNSEASGKVVKIHFDSGQYLGDKSPLIDIDDHVDQATLKFNLADLALKQLSFQRQSDLFKKGAASSSMVDEASASLQQAQASVEKIQAEINKKHIATPFAGQLGIRQVNLGQYITPGQTSIVTLQSLDPLYLQFYLPEQQLRNLYINQPIIFSVEAFPKVFFKGKITALNSKVDTDTHNILVQATLPNCPAAAISNPQDKKLVSLEKEPESGRIIVSCNTDLNTINKITQFTFIPGMFASIAVELPNINDVVVLPSTAISYSLYGDSVFIIEKDKNGEKDAEGNPVMTVRRVYITTGLQEGNYTVISKGLETGQLVVGTGEMKLKNGTRVVINNKVQLDEISNPDKLSQ